MRPIVSILGFIVPALLLGACSSGRYERPVSGGYSHFESLNLPRTVQSEVEPWEIIPQGRLVSGEPIRSVDLLAAEQQLRLGQRKQALDAFIRAAKVKRSPAEMELIYYRIASLQLSLNMEKQAIANLSRYFKALKRSEDEVPPPFALVLAYAFGADRQLDQSVAWFLKAKIPQSSAALQESIEKGLRLLLRSLSAEDLEAMAGAWRNEPFVYGLIAQERQLRTQPQYAAIQTGRRFWRQQSEAAPVPQPPVTLSQNQIGVILPLTGQFSALGTSTKNGIELAAFSEQLNVLFRDDAGNSSQTEVLMRELYGQGVSFILGPLITESAIRAAQVARELRVPILTFAKGGEFEAGAGVFRLGPTVASQVESLLESLNQELGIRRIAIVYPNDPAGQEFNARFKEELAKYGLQPVVERSFTRGEMSEFVQIASEIDDIRPEAVFFPDSLRSASRFFPNLRSKVRPLGTVAWDNPQELQQSRAAMEGAIFVSAFFAQSGRPEIQQFIASYQGRFGAKPDFLAAQGFDAAQLVLEALRRSGDPASVAQSFLSIENYDGLTGMIGVDGSGEVARRFTVVSLEAEGLRPLEKRQIITRPRQEAPGYAAPGGSAENAQDAGNL